jgi:hypothetical protein
MEKAIHAKEMGSLEPHEEELMLRGKELADKFDLKFNGWWEVAYTFTVPETQDTFLAKDENELINKLKKFRNN